MWPVPALYSTFQGKPMKTLLPLLALLLAACASVPPDPVVVTRAYAKPLVVDKRPPLPFLDDAGAWRGQPVEASAQALLLDVRVLDAYATYLLKAIETHNASLAAQPAQPAQ